MQRAVELEAMRLYLAVVRERELLTATDERRRALQSQIDGLQRRVDEGHVAEADVLKLRTEAARLDADMTRSRLTLRRRLDALAALLAGSDRLSADDLVLPPPLAPPEPAAPVPWRSFMSSKMQKAICWKAWMTLSFSLADVSM